MSLIRNSKFAVVLALSLAWQTSSFAMNQDDVATTDTEAQPFKIDKDADLPTLIAQWKELDQELADKEVEFKSTTDTEQQEDIKGQYTALVDQSEQYVTAIRERAAASLNSGSLDEMTSKTLVGLIMNDAEFGRNDEAIKLGDQMIAAGIDGALFEQAAKSSRLSVFSKELLEELFIRTNQSKQDNLPKVKITTSKGDIVVELFEDEAPNTVANFVSLVESRFYDSLKFHRVIEGFVAQGGDPNGDGSGGPGYTIKCECESPESRRHFFGSLSMAHAGKDSGGSQFFLCLARTSHLDGRHTVFGRVIEGLDVLDKLSRNYTMNAAIPDADTDTINSMEVVKKREHEYKPVKVGDDLKTEEQPPAQPETQKEEAGETTNESEGN